MNETKVDVLAVMDEAASHADGGSAPVNGDAMRQARDDVAYLIASARKHNEAVLLFGEESVQANQTLWLIRDALARIGGGK